MKVKTIFCINKWKLEQNFRQNSCSNRSFTMPLHHCQLISLNISLSCQQTGTVKVKVLLMNICYIPNKHEEESGISIFVTYFFFNTLAIVGCTCIKLIHG